MARVLVVEDDAQMRRLIAEVLAVDGHDTVKATEGGEALVIATQGQVDAAIVDVMLPGMSGFELCRHLRRHEVNIGVLLLTARSALDDRIAGLDSGADDYLTKPFEEAELRARLRSLLRRQQRVPGVLGVGDLQLDPIAFRVRAGGRPLALSVKEFSLLRVLASSPGTVITRHTLLTEVWGDPKHFDGTIVDQYVSYVRKKLAARSSTVVISTVRGQGYRLDAGG